MPRRLLITVLSLLLAIATAFAAANDPWEKPWTQWTKGECEQVLDGTSESLQVREIHPVVDSNTVYVVGAPVIRAAVQWSTAIHRRQANLRLRILSGVITEQQAKEGLQQTREHIILQLVLITNVDSHFRDAAALEKNAQSSAYLQLAKSKTKIPAVKAEVVPRKGAGDPTIVRLYFARAANGQPAAGADEKEIMLVWPELVTGFKPLEAKFEVKKLAADPANGL